MKTFLLWLAGLLAPHREAVPPQDVVVWENNTVTHLPDRYCETGQNTDGIVIWFYSGESDGMMGMSDSNCTAAYQDWTRVHSKFDVASRI